MAQKLLDFRLGVDLLLRDRRGGKARAGKTPKLCILCRDPSKNTCGNNPYCQACKCEHDAMQKDAKENGWLDKFESGKQNPVIFKKMVMDFRFQCPSRGRGRPRTQYKFARLDQIFERATVLENGVETCMMDWFEFSAFYESKKMDESTIES